ncbi:hypothetical protein Mapa_009362 [Marchantia paleacea]|nr:hypothetical protein Mapa_009362 [Marchantia paleacea]
MVTETANVLTVYHFENVHVLLNPVQEERKEHLGMMRPETPEDARQKRDHSNERNHVPSEVTVHRWNFEMAIDCSRQGGIGASFNGIASNSTLTATRSPPLFHNSSINFFLQQTVPLPGFARSPLTSIFPDLFPFPAASLLHNNTGCNTYSYS